MSQGLTLKGASQKNGLTGEASKHSVEEKDTKIFDPKTQVCLSDSNPTVNLEYAGNRPR